MARFCESCGTEKSENATFCSSCGTRSGAAASASVGRGDAVAAAREEYVILDEAAISVTSARLIASGQTYAMSGITSVKQGVTYPPKLWPILMILVGFILMLAVLNSHDPNAPMAAGMGSSIFLLVVGFLWLRSKRPVYAVVLTSASGETKAYTSTDQSFVDRIIKAINDAIVHRG